MLGCILISWVALVSFTFAGQVPVISGWNPDPSVLRVGDKYYAAVDHLNTIRVPPFTGRQVWLIERYFHMLSLDQISCSCMGHLREQVSTF